MSELVLFEQAENLRHATITMCPMKLVDDTIIAALMQDTALLLDHRLSGVRAEVEVHNRQRAADLTFGARSRSLRLCRRGSIGTRTRCACAARLWTQSGHLRFFAGPILWCSSVQGSFMIRREFIVLFFGVAVAWPNCARAHSKMFRVGLLTLESGENADERTVHAE
jgi:hypothetical protein